MIFGTIIRKLHALEHTSVRLWASKARFLIADHVSGSAPRPKVSARSSCQTPCCGRYLGARSPTGKQSQDYLWNGQESGPCHPSSDAGAGCSGKLGQSTLQKPIRFFVSARSISSSPVFCHVYSLPRMRDRDQVYGRASTLSGRNHALPSAITDT